jgi:hypothetical protein
MRFLLLAAASGPAASGPDLGLRDFLVQAATGGFLALGIVIGIVLTYGIYWIMGHDARERNKLDREREKRLDDQLVTKEKRIDELHQELLKLQNALSECIKKTSK